MNKYEFMMIFDNDVITFDDNKIFVKDLLTNNKVEIIEEKDIGQRDLSFPIKEKKRGHYYLYNAQSEAKSLPQIESAFKLHKGILRYLIIRQK